MNEINKYKKALKASVQFVLDSSLLMRSGVPGDFTDSSIEKTPDNKKLHVNGYVWNSLIRRAAMRVKDGDAFAKRIGKYPQRDRTGVSPLWCESSFIELPETDIKWGIKINRKYCSASKGALYSDEIVPPGLQITMNLIYFSDDKSRIDTVKELLKATFYVIHEGIENIGGGWSYGFGRLRFQKTTFKELDLTKDRDDIWKFHVDSWDEEITTLVKPQIVRPWVKLPVKARIAAGQLLAVHSSYPAFDSFEQYDDFPDHFVYRRYHFKTSNEPKIEIILPGKGIRQGLLSAPIERMLRSQGKDICETPEEYCTCSRCKTHRIKGKGNSPDCECLRCAWFGSTTKGGVIAVTDAVINNPKTVILNRIQLCEHSMQNINLFSGEYLTSESGEFEFSIFIDGEKAEEIRDEYILPLLKEMKPDDSVPPGWYRIGATSTCTGQIEVV